MHKKAGIEHFLLMLLQLWLILLTSCYLVCQNRRYKHSYIKRNILVFNNDDSHQRIQETTNATTKQNTLTQLLTKLLFIFAVCAGFALLLVVIITVIYFYVACGRPGRIRQQISIEYLDSTEMINYSESPAASPECLTVEQRKEVY